MEKYSILNKKVREHIETELKEKGVYLNQNKGFFIADKTIRNWRIIADILNDEFALHGASNEIAGEEKRYVVYNMNSAWCEKTFDTLEEMYEWFLEKSGQIQHVKMYNHALSASDIQQNYTTHRSRYKIKHK